MKNNKNINNNNNNLIVLRVVQLEGKNKPQELSDLNKQ